MAAVTTRAAKGISLTHAEVDANFNNLNAQLEIVYMPGELRYFSGAVVPAHWLKCEGQLFAIADYPELYAAIGTAFGGDGVISFALPEYKSTGGIQRIICAGATLSHSPLQVKIYAGIHGPAAGSYSAGASMEFFVNFVDPVIISGGPPLLNIDIGGINHVLTLSSATSTVWAFAAYIVQSGDEGDVVASVNLNGSVLTDASNNSVLLEYGYTPAGITISLVAAAQSVSSTSGILNQDVGLVAAAQSVSSTSGILNQDVGLVGDAQSVSSASGTSS